jgi:hypothetical protein
LPAPELTSSLPDISDDLLNHFLTALDCSKTLRSSEMKVICSLLVDFKGGQRPDLYFPAAVPWIGPVYTVDENARLKERHYDVLMGTARGGEISFFSLESGNGRDAFELQALLEARMNKRGLDPSPTLERIYLLAPKKHFAISSTGRSLILLPDKSRRVYFRKVGDHLVMIGPFGTTPDEQLRSSLVIAPLF